METIEQENITTAAKALYSYFNYKFNCCDESAIYIAKLVPTSAVLYTSSKNEIIFEIIFIPVFGITPFLSIDEVNNPVYEKGPSLKPNLNRVLAKLGYNKSKKYTTHTARFEYCCSSEFTKFVKDLSILNAHETTLDQIQKHDTE